jgi:hypothetical protein
LAAGKPYSQSRILLMALHATFNLGQESFHGESDV